MADDEMPTADEQLIALFGPGGADVHPSPFTAGRYARLAPNSTIWAWFLGAMSLVVPPVSVFGIRSAFKARQSGSRVMWVAAAVWCVVMGATGVWIWLGTP